MPHTDTFCLLLRLPSQTVHALDEAASTLRMSRSAFIRKSIARNLQYSIQNEVPLVRDNPALQTVLERV